MRLDLLIFYIVDAEQVVIRGQVTMTSRNSITGYTADDGVLYDNNGFLPSTYDSRSWLKVHNHISALQSVYV